MAMTIEIPNPENYLLGDPDFFLAVVEKNEEIRRENPEFSDFEVFEKLAGVAEKWATRGCVRFFSSYSYPCNILTYVLGRMPWRVVVEEIIERCKAGCIPRKDVIES